MRTSGSRAAFSITVSPFASVAAIMIVWVAPTETCGKRTRPPVKPARRLGDDVAALDVELRAERLEPHQEEVDRPRADGAAAGQRHARLVHAREQRPDHPEARAHARDELVGRGRVDDVRGARASASRRHSGVSLARLPLTM